MSTPAPSHQSSPGPTASTMPCWGGGSSMPCGTTRPDRRIRSWPRSLRTTWPNSGLSWCLTVATGTRDDRVLMERRIERATLGTDDGLGGPGSRDRVGVPVNHLPGAVLGTEHARHPELDVRDLLHIADPPPETLKLEDVGELVGHKRREPLKADHLALAPKGRSPVEGPLDLCPPVRHRPERIGITDVVAVGVDRLVAGGIAPDEVRRRGVVFLDGGLECVRGRHGA